MSFRGGRAGGTQQRTILPFGLEYADILSSSQEAEKPQLLLPVNGDATEVETIIAKQSINFTKIMSDGPFFTGNLDSITSSSDDEKKKTNTTAADGIERYSDRYKKVQKIGRTIEEHPYQAQYFPQELYPVMGISNKEKRKILMLSKFHSNGGLREFLSNEQVENMDEEAKVKAMQEKMLSMVANSTEGDDHRDEHSGDEEEDIDDEFDDDDNDDYNAEKYFDDGDDDGGDDGGDDEAAF